MIALKKSPQITSKRELLQRGKKENVMFEEAEPLAEMPENSFAKNLSGKMMGDKKLAVARKRQARPVTAMFRSSAPSASAPEADSFMLESKFKELSDKVAVDKRIAELEEIIDNYDLELEAGPLDIKVLAIKGLIPAEKLDYFAPPPGMNWFLQIKENSRKVILKKEK